MQIKAFSNLFTMDFHANLPPAVVDTRRNNLHEIDTRTSRYTSHRKKESRGWKPSKHQMHMNCQKGHQQNRGMAHRLGDARVAQAARAK